jgi:FtsZ-interacting cell division protein ZipA
MNTSSIIVMVVAAVAVIVIVALLWKARRTQKLKSRFGPEYERAINEAGSRNRAEARLEKLEKRVQRFHLIPLSQAANTDFLAQWQKIQFLFVDDPRVALAQADQLIQKLMAARGYPMADFDQRALDISVDHPLVFEQYRLGHEIALRHAQGQASTEEMRHAMIHYRTLFNALSGEPEKARAATGRA